MIIPCLNEEEAIALVIDKAFEGIRRTGKSGEVVVVDNGSTDASACDRRGERRDRRATSHAAATAAHTSPASMPRAATT